MKKSILIWAVLLFTATSFSYANPADEVNNSVKTSFKKDFGNPDEVKWENQKGFLIATFSLNGKITYAYYSKSGNLIAVTRNILSSQLPIRQLLSLEKNYKGYWITDLFEIDANQETSYFITLENADYKLVLKSDDVEGWNEYKKEKKE
jgi:hypothetical protein